VLYVHKLVEFGEPLPANDGDMDFRRCYDTARSNADLHPHLDADRNQDANEDADCNAHVHGHKDAYAYSHINRDSHGHAY
jgi:hypothetical protein